MCPHFSAGRIARNSKLKCNFAGNALDGSDGKFSPVGAGNRRYADGLKCSQRAIVRLNHCANRNYSTFLACAGNEIFGLCLTYPVYAAHLHHIIQSDSLRRIGKKLLTRSSKSLPEFRRSISENRKQDIYYALWILRWVDSNFILESFTNIAVDFIQTAHLKTFISHSIIRHEITPPRFVFSLL